MFHYLRHKNISRKGMTVSCTAPKWKRGNTFGKNSLPGQGKGLFLIKWLLPLALVCCLISPVNAQNKNTDHQDFLIRFPNMSSSERLAALEEAMGSLLYSSKQIISLLDKPTLQKRILLAEKFAETNLRLKSSALLLQKKLFPKGTPLTDSAKAYLVKNLTQIQNKAEKQAKSLAEQHQKLDEQKLIACSAADTTKAEKAEAQTDAIINQISYLVAGVSELKRQGAKLAEPYMLSKKRLKEVETQAREIRRDWLKNQKEFANTFGDREKALDYFDPVYQKAIELNELYLKSAFRANKIAAAGVSSSSISLENILNDIEAGKASKSEAESRYRAFIFKNKDLFKKARNLYTLSFDDDKNIFKEYYQYWPTRQPPQSVDDLKTTTNILNTLRLLDSINQAAVNSLKKAMAKAEKARTCLAALRKKRDTIIARLNCPEHAKPFWAASAEQPVCRCKKGWIFNTDKSACLPKNYCKKMILGYREHLKNGNKEKARAALNLLRLKKCPNLAALRPERTIPDVTKLPIKEAVSVLQKAGLGYAVSSAGQATEQKNARHVLEQSPKSGESVGANTVVKLRLFDSWNQAKAKIKADKLCAKKYPGASALWNKKELKFGCGCPKPGVWNRDKTACIAAKAAAVEKCRRQYPGSVARYSPKHGEYRCFCPDGMEWNEKGSACITAKARYQAICAKKYPGSSAVWNKKSASYVCTCTNGRRWNPKKTRCLLSQAEANKVCLRKIANTEARYIPEKDRYECFCAGGRFWQPQKKCCSQTRAEAQQSCGRKYPGSEARYSQKKNDYLCFCPDGYTWNKNRTACVQTAQSAQAYCSRHYPGTTAKWVKEMAEFRCFCPGNGRWDPQTKKCQGNKANRNQARGSNCSRLAQAYMQEVNGFKSTGGSGSTAGLWNILNQAQSCNWYFQEARNVKCLDLARKFDQAFGYVNPNNQHSANVVQGILTQGQINGCAWVAQAQSQVNLKINQTKNGNLGNIFKGGAFDKDSWKVKNVPKVNIPQMPKGGNLGGK